MTRIANGQVLFAFTLIALNTVYASQLLQMEAPFANGEPGPAFLPMMLCVFVYIAMVRILFTELRAEPAERAESVDSDLIPNLRLAGPLIAIGLTAAFIIGFFYVGYLAAALVYTFLIALFFMYEQTGDVKRSALFALIIGVCVTAFGWLFFVELFGLYLPVWEL